MMLTSVNVVSPSTSMNVVRIDTAAMSSGSSARNDANTKSSTSSAPAAAEQRLDQNARALLVAARGEQGVGRQPASKPSACGRLVERGVELGLDVGTEDCRERRLDQGVRRAPVIGHEAGIARAGEVDDPQLSASGTAATAVREDAGDGLLGLLDGLALRHGDDGDVGVDGADAVGVDELLLGVVAGLAGQREVQRPPVAERD